MSFTLLVTPTADADATETHVFDQDVVVIGRDSAADLTLNDVARIVSNRHAEVRQTGDTMALIDLGSKNGTVFNGRRLRSGEVAPLREADAFEVGDFEIRVALIAAAGEVEAESETRVAHEKEEGGTAAVASNESGEEALLGVGRKEHDAEQVDEILELPPTSAEDEREDQSDLEDSRSEGVLLSQNMQPSDTEMPAQDGALEETLPPEDEMLDALVAAVARLAGIPWQFRHEFIGQTIAPPEEEAVFADGSPEALRRYLFAPQIDSDEQAERRASLAAAAEAGALHQVAMLDGYKAGMEVGTRHLLEELNPEMALEEVGQGGFWQRLPILRDLAALKRLRQSHRELAQEDEAVAERGRFRPAFIKAYLARMTRRTETPDDESASVPS